MDKYLAALTAGGGTTLAFIAVVEAGVIALLFRELQKVYDKLQKAYQEDGKEVTAALNEVSATQGQHTTVLATVAKMLEALVYVKGGRKS